MFQGPSLQSLAAKEGHELEAQTSIITDPIIEPLRPRRGAKPDGEIISSLDQL